MSNLTTNMWLGRFSESLLTKEYFSLCSKPSDDEFTEIHHILPKSLFPEYTKCKWNLVKLAYRDHYKAHEILPFICVNLRDKYKMVIAWEFISTLPRTKEFITADLYTTLKTLSILAKTGKNSPNFGKPLSEETKLKISKILSGSGNPRFGVELPDELKKRISESLIGFRHSEESKLNMSKAHKTYIRTPEHEKNLLAAKVYSVPLYGGEIWLFKTRKGFEAAYAFLGQPSFDATGSMGNASHLQDRAGKSLYLVGVYDKSLGTLVHELCHITIFVTKHAGISIGEDSGEPACYLLGDMYEKLAKAFK